MNNETKQISVPELLFLIFLPAVLILGAYLFAIQFKEVIPPFLSMMIIILVVLISLEIGIILRFSKIEHGSYDLQSAFATHNKLSAKDIIKKSIIPFIIATAVFLIVAPLEHKLMFSTIFQNIPEYFKLADFMNHLGEYSKFIIILTCISYS